MTRLELKHIEGFLKAAQEQGMPAHRAAALYKEANIGAQLKLLAKGFGMGGKGPQQLSGYQGPAINQFTTASGMKGPGNPSGAMDALKGAFGKPAVAGAAGAGIGAGAGLGLGQGMGEADHASELQQLQQAFSGQMNQVTDSANSALGKAKQVIGDQQELIGPGGMPYWAWGLGGLGAGGLAGMGLAGGKDEEEGEAAPQPTV